jgi:cytochrome c556
MRFGITLLGALALGLSGLAVASDDHAGEHHGAETPYDRRHEFFEHLGGHMKAVGKFAKSEETLNAEIVAHAKAMFEASQKLESHFAAGTGPDKFPKTRAKAEIWTSSADFAAAVKNFQTESAALVKAAEANDTAAFKAQAGKVGPTCGGCHEKFRKKEE